MKGVCEWLLFGCAGYTAYSKNSYLLILLASHIVEIAHSMHVPKYNYNTSCEPSLQIFDSCSYICWLFLAETINNHPHQKFTSKPPSCFFANLFWRGWQGTMLGGWLCDVCPIKLAMSCCIGSTLASAWHCHCHCCGDEVI